MRDLKIHEVTFEIRAEPEDIPIEGNAMASGDDAVDEDCYRWIREQLARGNVWAWCTLHVVAEWKEFKASAVLGCCSYKSEQDAEELIEEMQFEALSNLNHCIRNFAARMKDVEEELN